MAHSHDKIHFRSSIFAERPTLTAIVIGSVFLLPHFLLTENLSVGFAATFISLIAGIYFGFAVVNGSTREQMIEVTVAGLFLSAAMLGLALWPGIIALAYLGHAVWDFAHHNRMRLSLVQIPSWYVPWCAIIDVIIGVGLIVVWRIYGVI
jgi:hypothetical protein